MGNESATIQIRQASEGDRAALVEFNIALARETERRDLDPDTVRAGVLGVFKRPERGSYWVAEAGGSIVGQTLITHEWSDWRNGEFWWLQSVYVQPSWRERGVFRKLWRSIVEAANLERDVVGVRLYVENHNQKAQLVYRRMGFRDSGYRVFEWTKPALEETAQA